MNLRELLLRTWEFLYPPYELSRYGPNSGLPPEEPAVALIRGKKAVSQDVQQSHIAVAEAIYKSEIDRKKNIEDKAVTYLAGVAISSSILVALPALLTERINGPLYLKVMVLIVFMIAVGYLVVSAIYAVKVRARAPYYVINSASLQAFELTAEDFRRRWALHLIDLVRRNESLLLLKANQLYLAEKTFLRGIVIAGFGGLLLGIFAIAYPKVQTDREQTVNSVGGRDSAVVTASLVSCVASNSSLSIQLLAEGKALGELRAELASSLKAQAELKSKLKAKRKSDKVELSSWLFPKHTGPLLYGAQQCLESGVIDVQE